MVTLSLLVAACPEIPQPFRPEGFNPLTLPQAPRGVAVRPIEVSFGPALAKAMVDQFGRADIPATLREPATGAWLVENSDEGGLLRWILRAPDGGVAATYDQKRPLRAEEHVVKAMAADAVNRLSGPLRGEPFVAALDRRPKVKLVGPAGLPGDGDKALERAMRSALDLAGLAVRDDAETVVTAKASAVPGSGGAAILDVAWIVSRGNTELGRAAQRGEVPTGRLDQPWGGLARDIAGGGAEGVAEIVRAASDK
jgi:hypothetical protein